MVDVDDYKTELLSSISLAWKLVADNIELHRVVKRNITNVQQKM